MAKQNTLEAILEADETAGLLERRERFNKK